ncbi:hypothetical protein [Snodgrassella sp. ESL0324]|uniref:hypothetical protein n=1 Tax=Snodgrassella sp. ESL0324 TaxID=2705033 RepID=UPI001582AC9D|nr:hypothetical protein [Snodgrassella sp. ESL0324]NUF08922.1 hypothetical protein [Snodgrassella sp. ESL0324]
MLEVIKVPEKPFVFPVARRHIEGNYIVVFFSTDKGFVIKPDESVTYELGEEFTSWTNCFDHEHWEPVDITITG